MSNPGKPSGCPFHADITLAARHEGGGVPYKSLASKVAAHGLDPVLGDLEAVPQRALTAYYTSQIFWSIFERDHAVDHEWLSHRLGTAQNRYCAFMEEARQVTLKALKTMARTLPVDVNTTQKEAHAKLTEIVTKGLTKGTQWPVPEAHLNNEIDGAVALIISISELIDRLYQRDCPNPGGPIPGELFKKILRSPEFGTLTLRLANGSEALIAYINMKLRHTMTDKDHERLKVSGLLPCMDLDHFYLDYESGKDYPILHIKEGVLEELIRQFEAEVVPGEQKVRCPAADISVRSFYSGKNISMVKATLEWLVEEVMAPHL